MTVRELFVAMGFKVDESSLNEVEKKINSVKSFAAKALGALGIGFSLAQMNTLAEEFNGINDQIKSATAGLGNQKEIQEKIMKSANDTKMSYADTAKVVGALVQENKELFGSVDEAVAFNDTLTKLFKTAGKSNDEIAGLMEAVNKSFAKGKVDTETLNQLMERSPEAVEYLNKQLGSTTEQLEKMASDGRISLADLKDAFILNADEIDAKFGGLDYSISDALLNIRNRWGYWLDDINASIGLTKTLAKYMTRAFNIAMNGLNKARDMSVKVVDKFGGIENVFRFIAIAAVAAFAAFNGKKVLDFMRSFTSLLNVANLKILAIIAVITAIALVAEDFVNFMQGNGSVVGEILGKMGYDADEVRDRIIVGWNKVKGFLLQVWLALQNAGGQIAQKLKEFWVKNGDEIKEKLTNGFRQLFTILGEIFRALYNLAVEIFGALREFWEKWGDQILEALSAIFSALGGIIKGFLLVLQGIIKFLRGVFSGDWEEAWAGIQKIFEGILLAIQSFFVGIWNAIYAFFGEKIDACIKKVTDFVDKVKAKLQAVKDFFGDIGDFISGVDDLSAKSTVVQNTTVANAAGSGNRTNNISQDVKIENTFNGTDPETMSKAATKSAEDTTDQLAKGLKYGT
ncbi:hypothetical protein D7V94_13435 [Parablautia intestinalis]|uniref:Tape measure protein N-terminal domain-containing protein n=1 Tax=Parablautia intestinalis TaxID=2320100 RepID=A0A3A9AS72_9FIRM|nr:tape measure protein [Parablautia intestinalis]RKI90431.1 hypothetical protein D7V94_13435 [Parablautia intestinalis]